MHRQFIRDEAPEYELFTPDKLEIHSQFVQDETLEHGLFEDEVQMASQLVQESDQDEALKLAI